MTVALTPLPKDLRAAASTLGRSEARFLVDLFYQMQDQRISLGNQGYALGKTEEPHDTITFFKAQFAELEGQIKAALEKYAAADTVGQWAMAQHGIGPIIAAGLLAHIDIEQAPTVGHIWSFAGLDPRAKWEKGQRRPWNAQLKVLCWKIGGSFVKFSGSEKCYYGHLYVGRKRYEVARNEAVMEVTADLKTYDPTVPEPLPFYEVDGWTPPTTVGGPPLYGKIRKQPVEIKGRWFVGGNAEAAATMLETKNFKKAEVIATYSSGKLPDGQIDNRARRYATKIFLSHLHHVWHVAHYGTEPPRPYAIAHLGHVDYFPPPPGA